MADANAVSCIGTWEIDYGEREIVVEKFKNEI